MSRWALTVVAVLVLAGCAAPSKSSPLATAAVASPSAAATAGVAGLAPAPTAWPAAPPGLVAIIVMENHSPDQVLGQPYLSSLAVTAAVLSNYSAVSHPSLPNYLALTSGSTWGITDDGYHRLPSGRDLGAQLTAASIPWGAYMEGLVSGCRNSPSPYAVKHNPFAYYGGACPANVRPFNQLERDLRSSAPPRFLWITPNLCDDDHDCSAATGDDWLRSVVPMITRAPSFGQHGALFIVWDEGGSNYDHAAAVVSSPDVRAHTSAVAYNHFSVLGAIEDRLGLARLGAAAGTDPLGAVLAPLR